MKMKLTAKTGVSKEKEINIFKKPKYIFLHFHFMPSPSPSPPLPGPPIRLWAIELIVLQGKKNTANNIKLFQILYFSIAVIPLMCSKARCLNVVCYFLF